MESNAQLKVQLQVYDYFDKYTFLCEMYDEEADKIIELVLNYFPFDNSCQVIDAKKGKNLVSRVQLPTLRLEMLEIGNIINVFSKLLRITDCAPATRKKLFYKFESTFALIKPVPPNLHGKIITFITKKGFRIVRMKNGKISKEVAIALYNHISGSSMLPLNKNSRIIIDYVTSGEVIGIELVGRNAIKEWRRCLGATDPADAEPGTLRHLYGENTLRNIAHGCNTAEDDLCRQLYPTSIRALYGSSLVHNAVHCTDLPEDGVTEVEYFFKLLANERS
ncbi:hypothetical protein HF086_009329 [Spodoptera exigua]|uniref:DM10 domain-containing protein n=1 Tax=Spodoptera exigua TaxID=7107 RepID=A0A922MIX8_SPOEX|nr:hypothetical protein HF086_009329 [Spodoptera exigua]